MSTFEQETRLKNVYQDKNGWYRIETESLGRLDTNNEALASEAYALFQKEVPVVVKGKEDKVNKDGRWFTNRYLNSIRESTQQQIPMGGNDAGGIPRLGDDPSNFPPQVIEKMQEVARGGEIPKAPNNQDLIEGRIVRTASAKLAVWSLPYLEANERSPAVQVRVAEFWRAYIYGGARAVGVAPLGGPAPPPEPELAYAGAPPEDDIPF